MDTVLQLIKSSAPDCQEFTAMGASESPPTSLRPDLSDSDDSTMERGCRLSLSDVDDVIIFNVMRVYWEQARASNIIVGG